jgi:clan AA aspartic protease
MIRGQVNAFRQAVVPLQLISPTRQVENVEAVVDTGFDGFLSVSPDLVTRLQLPFMMTRFYELGDGSQVEFDIHRATVVWDGQEQDVEVLVTSGGVLVGMSLLHGYHLFVDAVDGGEVRIEPRP